MSGEGDWEESYEKAKSFVSQLTLLEKVNLTTGVGWAGERCIGNTGFIPRLGFVGFCTEDSPLGVRSTGINVASIWSTDLMYARGNAMGYEHRGKGIDVQLGPVSGPLGRVLEGGRNWEGFGPDPVLTGVYMKETIIGIQDAGVIAFNGTIPEWCLDDTAIRIIAAFYKVGRDKTRVPINFSAWTLDTTGALHNQVSVDYGVGVINEHVNVQGDHANVIREIGQRSIVLLQNNKKELPLSNPKSIAIIGEDAHPNPA
ncbi:hypothetical protein G7Y89_g10617 [Cudoniella acicularis]|uniref:beta-glucosidase n=1 Tax=Cudoniella acicularis TaxID=354080 RepID=A0A8H4VYV0_9HELO|nr:hypothetical protein G7Y89_g10617 [Cudoniella acicularis]